MQVFLETFGCQANERDSETILGMLNTLGYEACDSPARADLILLNTCSIRRRRSKRSSAAWGPFGG